jgi:hypothetical protein
MPPPHNPGIEQAERRAGQQDLFPEKDRKGDPPDIAMTGGPPRRTTIRVQIVVSRPGRNAAIAPRKKDVPAVATNPKTHPAAAPNR